MWAELLEVPQSILGPCLVTNCLCPLMASMFFGSIVEKPLPLISLSRTSVFNSPPLWPHGCGHGWVALALFGGAACVSLEPWIVKSAEDYAGCLHELSIDPMSITPSTCFVRTPWSCVIFAHPWC